MQRPAKFVHPVNAVASIRARAFAPACRGSFAHLVAQQKLPCYVNPQGKSRKNACFDALRAQELLLGKHRRALYANWYWVYKQCFTPRLCYSLLVHLAGCESTENIEEKYIWARQRTSCQLGWWQITSTTQPIVAAIRPRRCRAHVAYDPSPQGSDCRSTLCQCTIHRKSAKTRDKFWFSFTDALE